MHFADRLLAAVRAKRTAAVVGIDPVIENLPPDLAPASRFVRAAAAAAEAFSRTIIDEVADVVPAVKVNSAFFEAFFDAGVAAYYRVISHAHARGLLVIGDVKRGDIGSTAKLYARGHIDVPPYDDVDPAQIPDAVTLAGYLGRNAVAPFIETAARHGRGVFVLVRPSDPGADEIHEFGADCKLYQHLARLLTAWSDFAGSVGECGISCVGAVVAPKDADSTQALRASLPTTPFLVPGYGAQGASADACRPCFLNGGRGAIVNASRSVIYAYQNDRYRSRFGGDWRACIRQAGRDFAEDIARLAS
ncbi:MAG: orotidine-5'-phosphate decarboxylase [Planctomycetes bacterium]|nr:orotidine-5'-phosphate decarboxylase [Planctomycetota bacterium]